jgi:hypothetical protein
MYSQPKHSFYKIPIIKLQNVGSFYAWNKLVNEISFLILPYFQLSFKLDSFLIFRCVGIAGSARECLYDAMSHATLTQSGFNRDAIIGGKTIKLIASSV